MNQGVSFSTPVSTRAIGKSGRVLYAFSEFYLPCYERDRMWFFLNYEAFASVSALVYDVDDVVENRDRMELWTKGIDSLGEYLASRKAVDSHVFQLLQNARDYYLFEQRSLKSPTEFTRDDLREAIRIRSFDFRIMHRVLAQSCAVDYNESLFAWFHSFEVLMEIEDDLQSVREDEERETFNYYCLSKRLLHGNGPTFVRAELQAIGRELHDRLRRLSPELQSCCKQIFRRYRQAVGDRLVPA